MNTLVTALIDNAQAIGTFLLTAGAAWLKRRYDLKQLQKKQNIVDTFNAAK